MLTTLHALQMAQPQPRPITHVPVGQTLRHALEPKSPANLDASHMSTPYPARHTDGLERSS